MFTRSWSIIHDILATRHATTLTMDMFIEAITIHHAVISLAHCDERIGYLTDRKSNTAIINSQQRKEILICLAF